MPKVKAITTVTKTVKTTTTTSTFTKALVAAPDPAAQLTVPRDRWDRPLILPRGGHLPDCTPSKAEGVCSCMNPFTRMSTLSESLGDKTGLINWKLGRTVAGLSRRPDLALSAALLDPEKPADKSVLTKLAEQAMDAAATGAASNNGTTLHTLTERIDLGLSLPKHLPPHVNAMLLHYGRATERYRVEDTERFVVNEELNAAGTYDRRLYDEKTGSYYVGDLKTGKRIDYLGMKTCIQVVGYADAEWYELDGDRENFEADTERGLLLWLPWTDNAADAHCEVRWLDLSLGRRAVKVAMEARELYKLKEKDWLPKVAD